MAGLGRDSGDANGPGRKRHHLGLICDDLRMLRDYPLELPNSPGSRCRTRRVIGRLCPRSLDGSSSLLPCVGPNQANDRRHPFPGTDRERRASQTSCFDPFRSALVVRCCVSPSEFLSMSRKANNTDRRSSDEGVRPGRDLPTRPCTCGVGSRKGGWPARGAA
jgi:hypothetical protein